MYVAMYNNQFLALDNEKWIAIHISTKVSIKIIVRKRHVYIDSGWPWIWNQCFYLGIRNDDRTKMIVLPSFQLATRLNSQNTHKTKFNNELWHINMFMNIGISKRYNWRFDLTWMLFLTLFHSLTRLLTSKQLKHFSSYLVVRNRTMWNTCF